MFGKLERSAKQISFVLAASAVLALALHAEAVAAQQSSAPQSSLPQTSAPQTSAQDPSAKPGLSPISLVRSAVGDIFSDDGPMISTDRNSVTPHPNAVPFGWVQVENGMTFNKFHRGGDMGLP